jgi:hypothetical protein
MQKGSNATVLTPLGQVDVVQRLPGMPEWEELVAHAEVYEFEGREIRVMNRATPGSTPDTALRTASSSSAWPSPPVSPGTRSAFRSQRGTEGSVHVIERKSFAED